MEIIQLQPPGMEAIAPFTGGGLMIDALIIQVQRITNQWRPQLSQMNADLVGASGCDGQLQPISSGATFQKPHFGVCLQSSPDHPSLGGHRPPDPAQQWMRPFDHIRIHSERHSELKPGNTL